MYWYGYDRPDEQAWAYQWLRQASMSSAWWCGDMKVTTASGKTRDGGDLGTATTSGTGCGIVSANLAGPTVEECDQLGRAMADVYAGVELPEGAVGALAFRVIR